MIHLRGHRPHAGGGKSTEIQNCAHTGYAGSAELNQLVITRRFEMTVITERFEKTDRFSAMILKTYMIEKGSLFPNTEP